MSLIVDIEKRFPSFCLDVSFEAGSETLGFLGASGCGKSLTLRCIAGLETPDKGKIVVNGQTYFDSDQKINLSAQKRKTALLFQNYLLFPNLTVSENIAAGIGKDVDKNCRAGIVSKQLERFGLEGFEKRYPQKLSGGQQQRVALARMLASEPGILMLDEPFSALDAHLKSSLEQDMLDLFDRYAGTILYVSHDIDEAFRFCDRIAVVDKGQISEIGKTKDIVSNPSTLATVKLSGCKNISAARKASAYELEAVDWGITLRSEKEVPEGVAYVGVRAFYLHRATDETVNVVPMLVDRVSDSRFERTVMVTPADNPEALRIQWKVDKLVTPEHHLPERGDRVDLFFSPDKLYLVTR